MLNHPEEVMGEAISFNNYILRSLNFSAPGLKVKDPVRKKLPQLVMPSAFNSGVRNKC